VHNELVEHAARVLRQATDGALDAAALYDRVSRETGILCGVRLMLDRLAAHPGRFALLPPHAALGDIHVWDAPDRAAYGAALSSSEPGSWPIVTLCEEQDMTLDHDELEDAHVADDHIGLRDLHRSLATLLQAPGADAALLADASSAVAALDAAGVGDHRPRRRRNARGRR
jgi:hypothetical protein